MDANTCFFNNDILYMKSLIGKPVAITTIENKLYNGIVYVIDPETKTVVLTSKNAFKTNLDFILYTSIKSLEVTSNEVANEEFLLENSSKPVQSDEALKNMRSRLKKWLEMNHLAVEEDGAILKLGDQLRIEPPYGLEQCFCSNTIVLDRIRTILEKMPVA